MSTLRRLAGETLVPAVTLIAAVVAWELATRAFHVPRFIMPAPSAILGEGCEWRYRFIEHTWVTLYETLGGFALSMAVGVPLAVLIVYSPTLRLAIYPLIILAQSVPKIAIAPVLLLMLGFGEFPKMVVAFLVAFFPVVVDTATGLAATPPELLDLSRSYRASRFKTFLKVRLPLALPFIFAAAKVAIDYAKDNDRLVIRGGGLGNQVLDAQGVEALAKLPSLGELRARLVGLLQTPASRLVGVLQAPGGQIARVLAAKARQGEAA